MRQLVFENDEDGVMITENNSDFLEEQMPLRIFHIMISFETTTCLKLYI